MSSRLSTPSDLITSLLTAAVVLLLFLGVRSRRWQSFTARMRRAMAVHMPERYNFVALAVAVAVMLVMLVMSYVELTTISSSVVEMQSELETLQTQQVALITKHEQAFDLSSVKEAAAEAGMSQPSDSQIYYIDLSEPDSATVYSEEKDGISEFLSMLSHGIYAAVEYFR